LRIKNIGHSTETQIKLGSGVHFKNSTFDFRSLETDLNCAKKDEKKPTEAVGF